MSDLKLIGLLAKTNDRYVFIPIEGLADQSESATMNPSGVTRRHTPIDVQVSKEKAVDYSLNGRLNKANEVPS